MLLNKAVLFQALNIIAFIITVIVNGLAGSTKLLNGMTSGDISILYPTLVTPADFTFAIWGIIYSLLLIFVIYQALPKNKDEPFLVQVNLLFSFSSLINVSWLFLWHYEFIVYSLILMVILLVTLILIYLRLNIGRSAVSVEEEVLVHLPFSVYLGWISMASIANISVVFKAVSWDGFGIQAETWAVVIICVGLLLSLVMLATRKDIAYSLVVVWALVGILVEQGRNETIGLFSEIGIVLLIVAVVVTVIVSRFKH